MQKGIQSAWEEFESPVAYIRDGDLTHSFTENGCGTKVHPLGYRSVHFVVKLVITKETVPAEIQVRTIFEEGWSEIDHQIRYPHGTDVEVLSQCLALFNRLAGSADEWGSYTRMLKKDWDTVAAQLTKSQRERSEMISTLEKVKQERDRDAREVRELQAIIDSLKAARPPTILPTTSTGMLGPNFDLLFPSSAEAPTFPSSGFTLTTGSTGPITNLKLCGRCGKAYSVPAPSLLGVLSSSRCPYCGFKNA